ncbi:histidine kinase [Fibrobacteres bacterium R8-0-B4]
MKDYSVLSEDRAKTPARIIIVIFAIIKTVFFAFNLGVKTLPREGAGTDFIRWLGVSEAIIPWLPRAIIGVILIIGIFIMTGSDKLTNRQKSILIPLFLAVVELAYASLFGGDRLIYFLLIGCSLLSLMYADVLGLFVSMAAISAITAFLLFVLKVRLLWGPDSLFSTELFNFISLIVMYILVFMLGRYSVNALNRFYQAGYIFDTLLKTSPNLTVVVDGRARVDYISKAFAEIVGVEKPEYAAGLPFIDIFPTAELKSFWNGLLQCEGAFSETFELDFGDGARRWFMISSEPLGESKVARTFECTEITYIVEAHNAAETASKSKSNFLATMSHEIRTPMNAILGISQIQLQRGGLPEDTVIAFENIYASGGNLLGIINDILDMSKIETGKMELNPIEYDTPSLINDAVQLNIVRIGSKQIDFAVDIDENMPSKLYGDELRIKQILNNVLSNAIKYTKEGRVKLSADCVTDNDGVTLRFTVEDTGQGMRPEDKEKLFSEYLRFNAAANRATEGTGLGLNITKKLAEMMGGTICAESEYGKGSVFTVTVRQKAVECPAIGTKVADQLRKFAFVGGRQMNFKITRERMPYGSVLVVDDVATNLYVAEGLLAPYQLKTDTADSGFTAIEKTEKGNVYDIIFMDHMMPVMDGIETARKLREAGYKGPIVALTANAIVGNDEMFMHNGFDGFISKPIDVRQLNEVLNKFVRDRHPEEAKKYSVDTTEQGDRSYKINQRDGVDQNQKAETAVKRPKHLDIAMNPRLLKFFCQDAEKAVATLRETVKNGDAKLFTITAHAMKSALANVGEDEASKTAAALENAGRGGDAGYISANVDGFIQTLESLISKFRGADNGGAVGADKDNAGMDDSGVDEDRDYLLELLRIIKSACDNYDDDTAYAALDRLKEKRWKVSTIESLEKIRDALFINSDFDNAGEMCSALFDYVVYDKVGSRMS